MGSPISPLKTKEEFNPHFIADFSLRSAKSYSDIYFNEHAVEIRDGAYPLHIALSHAAPFEVIRVLVLKAPGVLNLKNKIGQVPLDIAEEGHYSKEVIKFLSTESERSIKH